MVIDSIRGPEGFSVLVFIAWKAIFAAALKPYRSASRLGAVYTVSSKKDQGKNNAMSTAPIEDHERPAIPAAASTERPDPITAQRHPNNTEKKRVPIQPNRVRRSRSGRTVLDRNWAVDIAAATILLSSLDPPPCTSTMPGYETLNKTGEKVHKTFIKRLSVR